MNLASKQLHEINSLFLFKWVDGIFKKNFFFRLIKCTCLKRIFVCILHLKVSIMNKCKVLLSNFWLEEAERLQIGAQYT